MEHCKFSVLIWLKRNIWIVRKWTQFNIWMLSAIIKHRFYLGDVKNPCLTNLKADVSTAVGSEADISTTLKYLWRYIFHADWSIRITVGHINGEKQPLQQQADEKLIMFSCLTLLTVSEGNWRQQQLQFKLYWIVQKSCQQKKHELSCRHNIHNLPLQYN